MGTHPRHGHPVDDPTDPPGPVPRGSATVAGVPGGPFPDLTGSDLPARLAPATLAVAAGRSSQPGAPANVPPILTSTYRAGGDVAYARVGNPTWSALEAVLAALEGPGTSAVAFASGMAAVSAAAELLPIGGTVVVPRVAYSGTLNLMSRWQASGRADVRVVGPGLDELTDALPGADLVWLESPANPTLDVIDIEAATARAHGAGALVVADSTFATPLGCQPLELGVDVVLHSATKYLSGHSDVLLGAVVTRREDLLERLRTQRILGGAIPGPMEAWIALRGLRTFPLRFERACANAAEIAARALEHPKVLRVRHLSLPGDPGHEVAVRQMNLLGAVVSLELDGGAPAADLVAASTRVWVPATSLGGVESTLERRRRWPEESPAVPEGLLRLSVGIEDVADLWADLEDALSRLG